MNNFILRFFLTLFFAITITFVIHTYILSYFALPIYNDKIVLAYTLNVVLASIVFLFLYLFRKKYRDQLGFLYMAGSMLKFAMFFIFFYPSYKSDGNISTSEFAAFFIPYVISLIIETYYLIKLLNSPEMNQPKLD